MQFKKNVFAILNCYFDVHIKQSNDSAKNRKMKYRYTVLYVNFVS